jgi:hypothetical protein
MLFDFFMEVKAIIGFLFTFVKNFKGIYTGSKYLFKKIKFLNPAIKFIIIVLFCFFIFVLTPPVYLPLKSEGSKQLAISKAYLQQIQDELNNSIVLLGQITCISDFCIFTLYGNKVNLTINENQSTSLYKREPLIVYNSKENRNKYTFLKRLKQFKSPSPTCQDGEIEHLFTCNRSTLHTVGREGLNDGGYFKELSFLFNFESTKDMQSIAFYTTKPTNELIAMNTTIVVILLNHNEFTRVNYPNLENQLKSFINENRDPETINFIIKNQNLNDRIFYNYAEFVAKVKVLLNFNTKVHSFPVN